MGFVDEHREDCSAAAGGHAIDRDREANEMAAETLGVPADRAGGRRMDRTIMLIVMAAIFGAYAGFRGYHDTDSLSEFITGPYRAEIQFEKPTAAERADVARRFAAACAFAGVAAVVAGGWAYPAPPRRKWAAAAAAARAAGFVALTALALAAAAAYYRSDFAGFVQQHRSGPSRLRPQVWLGDLPLVRIPVIAGLTALTVALLVRSLVAAVAPRRARPSAPPPASGD
jgi:hypothetical protein